MNQLAAPTGRSDAFVLFGATGDLAFRKLYPALQALTQKGQLSMPIVVVARAGRTLDQLRDRVRESLKKSGAYDERACEELCSRLKLVDGNYNAPSTYDALCAALAGCKKPLYHLAIPPSMFEEVARGIAATSCLGGARLVVEKPFGRDLASAKALSAVLHQHFPEDAIFRIDHYLGKEPVQNLIYFHLANQLLDGALRRDEVEHVQITLAETLGMEGRGRFYEEVGAIRDVLQNHVLQLVACLAMECPVDASPEALRDEEARVLKALRRLTPADVVRGQYEGYHAEEGVAADSKVETYAALRLHIDNSRWEGVPFYVRAGKKLAVSATEILVRFKRPLWMKLFEGQGDAAAQSENDALGDTLRLRIGPEVVLAQGMRVKKHGPDLKGECIELVAYHESQDEVLPYERLFADALEGDTELFARQDLVFAQWSALDAILAQETPLFPYAQGSWGPAEAAKLFEGKGCWHDPKSSTRAGQNGKAPQAAAQSQDHSEEAKA